jgi:TPR repeat protein
MKAADDDMAQAQHLVGILHTDNLIVKKDYVEAYKWVKKASDQNYKPAIETKNDLVKHLPPSFLATINEENSRFDFDQSNAKDTSLSSQLGLVFIDFEAIQDTIREVKDTDLIDDLFSESNLKLADTLGYKLGDSVLAKLNSERIIILEKFAESGNSEALTILGRLYEEGIYFKRSLIKASMFYILASKLNYPKAKVLLLKIIGENFISELVYEIKNNKNPDAMFVFHGLWSLGLYHQIIKEDAIKYLIEAANINHLPAVIELGNAYYTDKIGDGKPKRGIDLWEKTAVNGNL